MTRKESEATRKLSTNATNPNFLTPVKPAANKGEPPGAPERKATLSTIVVKTGNSEKQHAEQSTDTATHPQKASAILKGPLKETAAAIEQAVIILQEITTKAVAPKRDATIELLQQALQHMSKAEDHVLEDIKSDVQLIKEKVCQTSTWAEMAAKKPATEHQQAAKTRLAEIQERNRQQKAEKRKEHQKFEVTLTAETSDEEIKALIAKETHEEITKRCRQAVLFSDLAEKPLLQAVQKLKSGDLRFRCDTTEDAQSLQNVN